MVSGHRWICGRAEELEDDPVRRSVFDCTSEAPEAAVCELQNVCGLVGPRLLPTRLHSGADNRGRAPRRGSAPLAPQRATTARTGERVRDRSVRRRQPRPPPTARTPTPPVHRPVWAGGPHSVPGSTQAPTHEPNMGAAPDASPSAAGPIGKRSRGQLAIESLADPRRRRPATAGLLVRTSAV